MADNVTTQTTDLSTLPDATTIATDDVGGAHYQRVKLDVGADGASSPVVGALPVSAAALPLPSGAALEAGNLASILTQLADPATQTTLAAVLAKLPADPSTETTLAALLAKMVAAPSTEAKQDAINTAIGLLAKLTDTQPVSLATLPALVAGTAVIGHVIVDTAPSTVVTGPLTDTQLRTSAVPVSLATAPSTPVTGTFWQATQPVSLASVPSHAVTNAGTFAVQNTPVVAASATLANVASSASSVTLLASNAARRGVVIYNESTAILYVKFGATASATSYTVQIPAGGYWEMSHPAYTGIIDGIWSAANGNARITELA